MAQKRKRPAKGPEPVASQKRRPELKEAALRTVRPRPLHFEEKIRILWETDPELEEVDGGAFAKWIRDIEEARQSGSLAAVGSCQAAAVVVGNTSKPPKQLPKATLEHPPVPVAVAATSLMAHRGGEKGIQVPKFRLLPERAWPQQPIVEDPDDELSGGAAYIRHRGQTQDELDMKVEYDLDSGDEEWLAHRNRKGGGEQLTEDDLERMIDRFEKAKHAIEEQRQAEWTRSGGRSADRLDNRTPAEVYPVANAIEAFREEFSSLTVRAVHNYWVKKASASKLPLLQRFWYDKPWARLLARNAGAQADSDSDSDDGIPFQGKDAPKVAARGRALDMDDAEDRLHTARQDLERLRTIADQVRRREKTKKRQLVQWRAEWRERVFLARKPKLHKKAGKAAAGGKRAPPREALAAKAGKAKPPKGRPKKVAPVAGGNPLPPRREAAAAGQKPAPSSSKGVGHRSQDKGTAPVQAGRQASLGVGIVSAVVDQLRRLGSWGSRGHPGPGPRAEAAPAGAPAAGRAGPSVPTLPLTRHQEAAAVDAAIQLSLIEQAAAAKVRQRKNVRFAAKLPAAPQDRQKQPRGAAKSVPQAIAMPARSPAAGASIAAAKEMTQLQAPRAAASKRIRQRQGKEEATERTQTAATVEQDTRQEDADTRADVPDGFSRRLRTSPGKPRGYVEWSADCQHGPVYIDRISKLAAFLNEHATCRPEWGALAQRPHEAPAKYEARLREAFPFSHSSAAVDPAEAAPAVRRPANTVSRTGKAKPAVPVKPAVKPKLASHRSAAAAAKQQGQVARELRALTRGNLSQAKPTASKKARICTDGAAESAVEAAQRRGGHRRGVSGSRDHSSTPEDASEGGVAPPRRITRAQEGAKPGKRRAEPRWEPIEDEAGGMDAPAEGSADDPASSSGSDTFVPAESDSDGGSSMGKEECRHLQLSRRAVGARSTRRNSSRVHGPQLNLPRVPLEWRGRGVCEAPSDVSSFSEGSGPSLFGQAPETNSGPSRRQQPKGGRSNLNAGSRKGSRLVAAARQRVRRAALRNAAK